MAPQQLGEQSTTANTTTTMAPSTSKTHTFLNMDSIQDKSKNAIADVDTGYVSVETPRTTDDRFPFDSLTVAKPSSRFAVQSVHVRECMAEFLGTLIMICFGMGVNNQVGLSDEKNGTWLSINVCWGIAVMLGVHASEGVSGAHLNPAVTIAHAVYGRVAWRKVPGYVLSQLLAAFCGAFMIYLLDYQTLNVVDPHRLTSQAHFATYPQAHISNVTAFYTEFLGSLFLVLGVYAITDKRNRPASAYGAPISFALLIMAIGMAFGMNTGYAINPARDFGPRLFTSVAGWGVKVFTTRSYYFWIPIVAPLLGGVAGGGLYKALVELHHPLTMSSSSAVPVDDGSMV